MTSAPQTPPLHPLVDGFSDAELYDRGRPVYGEGVARELIEQLGLPAGAPVLELGAGTGQLSRALLAGGLDLMAVEPLGPTRELLCRAIGRARVRAGVAEEIPLAGQSVQAVFAADSFHWFDESRAMPEIRRVLRAQGAVAILRTMPLFESPWTRELGQIMEARRPEHPAFGERGAAAALEEDPAFGPVTECSLTAPVTHDREGLIAYMSSLSWVATLPAEERGALIASIRELLERHRVQRSDHDILHRIWWARLL